MGNRCFPNKIQVLQLLYVSLKGGVFRFKSPIYCIPRRSTSRCSTAARSKIAKQSFNYLHIYCILHVQLCHMKSNAPITEDIVNTVHHRSVFICTLSLSLSLLSQDVIDVLTLSNKIGLDKG